MTEPQLRHQTTLWLRAISADLRRAIQQEVEQLRSSIEQRTAKLDAMLAASDTQLDQVALNVEGLAEAMAQEAVTQARQQADAAAQAALTKMRARLQTELDTMRGEFETTRTALETRLAETGRDIAAIRQKRDEHAGNLDQARERVAALEELNGQATLLRELAEARLEEEVQRRISIERQLDASAQELLLAKAETDARRLEAQVATEERRRVLEKAASPSPDSQVVLTAVKNGLDDLCKARRDEVLSTLVEQLSGHCSAVAVFAVTSQGLQLWKARAADARIAPPAQVASLEENSPIRRAFEQRIRVRLDVSPSDRVVGLWGTPLGHAMAMPVLAHGRVLAVVYGENSVNAASGEAHMLDTVAEIFVGCVNRRLDESKSAIKLEPSAAPQPERSAQHEASAEPTSAPASASQEYAVARQAGRVKIDGSVELFVDGVTSTLVDVSTLGAQVLSPSTLRPNGLVRMVLRNGTAALTCGGRVVWARLESSKPTMPAQFRAGIRFMDSVGIDAFISRRGARKIQTAK